MVGEANNSAIALTAIATRTMRVVECSIAKLLGVVNGSRLAVNANGSTGQTQGGDPLAKREARSHGAHHRSRARQADERAQAIDRLDPGAMRTKELLQAELPEFRRCPFKCRVTSGEQVEATD